MSKIPEGATHTYTVRGKTSYRRMAGDLWEAYIDGDWFGVVRPHAGDYVTIKSASEWMPSAGSIVHCGSHNRDVEILKEPELVPYVSAPCRALDNNELFWGGKFSPIKTTGQIADEKRLAAINWMEIDAGMCATAFDGDPEARRWIENLIDKGWIKEQAE